MKHYLTTGLLTGTGCLLLSIVHAYAAPAPVIPILSPAAQTVAGTSVKVERAKCSRAFYRYLPGMVDYCLGLRDWQDGNYRKGLKLLEQAASWGSKSAQYSLGLIYYRGHHIRPDRALGMAWLKLADERKNDEQIDRVARLVLESATPVQRQRAQKLFRQMRKRYGDKVAAKRAWQRLEHWKKRVAMQTIDGAGASGNACVVPEGSSDRGARSHDVIRMPHAHEGNTDGDLIRVIPNGSYSPPYSGSCMTLEEVSRRVDQMGSIYFQGWASSVSVGPAESVPAISPGN